MSQALHEFMHGLVDYAGLFPPAALSVSHAVAEYADHRTSAESWMLGRFIAAAGMLPAIAQEASVHVSTGNWPVSAIIGNRDDSVVALASLKAQGQNISTAKVAGLNVEVLELPLPANIVGGDDAASFLNALGSELVATGLVGYELFIEVKPGAENTGILTAVAAFAAETKTAETGCPRVGVKLRTGGLVAASFPTCDSIAGVIAGCRQESLPMKFTAGLHHPVRHSNAEIGVMMHGFINVFGAGILAHAHDLSVPEISAILAETNPSAFAFTESGFAWNQMNVEITTLRTLRSRYFCGFGSCSFTEPRDDLSGLALL